MYYKKIWDPKIEPCGMPLLTNDKDDEVFFNYILVSAEG